MSKLDFEGRLGVFQADRQGKGIVDRERADTRRRGPARCGRNPEQFRVAKE